MRIVTGRLGGRLFDSPGGHRTHPMSDKMRGALFNSLGDVHGLSILDAFAGSGALSLEAISRGAASALAIDIDKSAYETVQANVEKLDLKESITVMRKNISGWSRNNRDRKFDIVLADPPYDDIRPDVVERLAIHLTAAGIMVLSWPGSEAVREFAGLQIVANKNYGDAQLVFYRRIQ